MGDHIDQETAFSMNFLPTFRQGLQQAITAKTRPFCNDKDFDNICNTELTYALDFSFLPVPTQMLCYQLETSSLCLHKLRLNNIIILYVSRLKWHILPFEEELDANASHILNQTEFDRDDEESSEDEDLNLENP